MVAKENTEIRDKILALINEGGLTQTKISQTLGITPINLNKRIRRFKEKGYLTQKDRTYFLTESGITLISRRVADRVMNKGNIETIRKHNVRVRVPLRERLDNPQVFLGSLGVAFNPMGLKNVYAGSFSLDDYVVELMQQSVIVILPDVELPASASIEELAARTWFNLSSILDVLESRLGVRFKRPKKDFFIGEIVSRHIAFTNHPIAGSVKGEIKGLWVIEYSEEDGKPKLIIDFSDSPELEAVHPKEAILDADLIKKNLGKELKRIKSGEAEKRRLATESCIYALSDKLEREKQHRVSKGNTKLAYTLALNVYCLKHEGEKPRAELEAEFYQAVRPYL